MTPSELADARAAFKAAGRGLPCANCGRTRRQARLEVHHTLRQQFLRREFGEEVVWDPRWAMVLCAGAFSCHDRHTLRFKRVPRSKVPAVAVALAAELGVTYELEREYPEEG